MVIAINGGQKFEVKVTDGDGLDFSETSNNGVTYVTANPGASFEVHVRRIHAADSVSLVGLDIDGVSVGYFNVLHTKDIWSKFNGFWVNPKENKKFVFSCPKYGEAGSKFHGFGENQVGRLKITISPAKYQPCPGPNCSTCQFLGHGNPNLPCQDSPGQRKEVAKLKQKEDKKFFLAPSISVKAGPTVYKNLHQKAQTHPKELPNAKQFSISLQCETEATLRLRNILPRQITSPNAGSLLPGEEQPNRGRKRARPDETIGTVKGEITANVASTSRGRGGEGSSDIIDLTEDDASDDMIIYKVIKQPKREVVSL